MTFVKQMLLGSAAAMALVGGAQAADLPAAEAVEYVKVCNTYGEGFFYIPGSETCLQIAGYARAEYYAFDQGDDDDGNKTAFFTEINLDFDARTETEYGTLRTFIRLVFDRTTGDVGEGATSGGDFIEHALVQFGGLSAGRTTSFFDFYANENLFGTVAGSDLETQLLAYTASFGTGFSATISLEDATERTFLFNELGVAERAGQEWPDVVANLRVEQGWGTAQISGALHQVNPTEAGGGSGNKVGWAVQAGVSIGLDALAEGDTLTLQGSYAKGALGYLQAGLGFNGFYEGITVPDEHDTASGRTRLSEGYVLAAEFLHYWTPNLRSVFAGSFADIDDASSRIGAGVDFKEWIGAGSLVWSPVKKLDIGVEVGYTNIDYKRRGGIDIKDKDSWAGILRVERSF